jgi:hypothetical protein
MARGIPAAGHRCDPSKLLLDQYGKSFHGDFDFTQALFSDDLEAASENGGADRPPAPRRWWIRSGTRSRASPVRAPFR